MGDKTTFGSLMAINILVAVLLVFGNASFIYKNIWYLESECRVLQDHAYLRPYGSLASPIWEIVFNVELMTEGGTVRTSYSMSELGESSLTEKCEEVWGCTNIDFEPTTFELRRVAVAETHECWYDPRKPDDVALEPKYTGWTVMGLVLFPINWILGMVFGAMLIGRLLRERTMRRERSRTLRRTTAAREAAAQRQQEMLAAMGAAGGGDGDNSADGDFDGGIDLVRGGGGGGSGGVSGAATDDDGTGGGSTSLAGPSGTSRGSGGSSGVELHSIEDSSSSSSQQR